ncbi:hypothetical protein [Rhizobium sp. BR 314]|uniref:hypothetical protein n=1 Tax=Rhizobium sp. BR 314 TaxID=3040013 RepID=UPI0039BFDDA8
MKGTPESIILDFIGSSEDGGITGFHLRCFDTHDDKESGDPVSYISFGYDHWVDPEDRSDPEFIALAEKYGPKRLLISINGGDDLVYLSTRSVRAMMAIFQEYIK